MVNDLIWYREEKIIRDLIKDFEADAKRQEMLDGQRYYDNENDINDRQQFYYNRDHQKVVDETKPNNRIAHAYFKLLVDEKIGYFLGQPANVTAENSQLQEKLITIFDESFDDTLNDVGTEASCKGIAWLYVYIEPVEVGTGKLQFEIIPAEQVIPIWRDRAHRELEGVINYYYVTEYDIISGGQKEVLKVECWHAEGVLFYTEFEGKLVEDIGRMFPDMQERELPESGMTHFISKCKGMNWGVVPFIPFRNNSKELSDLRFVKAQIDAYDKGVSDLANVLEELKRLVLILKNYQGTDLNEFMNNLRYFGAIKVDDDGGVDKLDLSFSTESQSQYLDRLKRDLYRCGQGVDMDMDKFGSNPSGVALEFLYSGLKLKTDNLERKFKRSFQKLFSMACLYLQAIGQGSFDSSIAKVTFNRSIVSNVMEQIEAVAVSMSLISKKTALAKHPWVDDVDQELEQMAEDEQSMQRDVVPLAVDEDDEDAEDEAEDGSEGADAGKGD